ncbi:antitoxin VapB family protein [Candidatus Woesearchaeota archaeon]|nr:antitoxin VapB family protein [Candidatus Woesearchaeota archaeon]
MATKTLTITEDAYNILAASKFRDESFSQEIKRVFARKNRKTLMDLFGILSNKEAAKMRNDLERIRKMNIELLDERLKRHESS